MSFATPLWLLLLLLIPLIVLLHMRRRQSTEVASTRLWRLLVEADQPTVRLRRPPSMLALWLQLAAVTLLSLALAEPRWDEASSLQPEVFVVDASASMAVVEDGQTRYRRAVDEWSTQLRQGDGPWSVWRVGNEAVPLALGWDQAEAVRTALQTGGPSDGGVDWGAMADALAMSLPEGGKLTVATADPDAATRALQGVAEQRGARLEVRSYAAPFTNVAVAGVDVRQDELVADRWTFEVLVRRDGGNVAGLGEVTLTLSFQPDGTATPIDFLRRELLFSLGGTSRVQETIDLPGAGWLQVSIAHGGQEAYRSDDAWQAWLDPAPRRPVVLLISRRGPEGPVARALSALGQLDVLVATAVVPELLEDVDWVIVDGVGDPFLGGEAPLPASVLWLGSAPGVTDPNSLDRLDPAASDWRLDHPLTLGTAWSSLDAAWAVDLPELTGAQTLVRGLDGPLVQLRSGRSREAIVALDAADPAWTNSVGFVTFLADAAAWMAPPSQVLRSCLVGTSCRLPWSAVAHGAEVRLGDEVVWRGPTVADGLPSRLDDAWVPERAGHYTIDLPDGRGWSLPVNASPAGVRSVSSAISADPGQPAPTMVSRQPRRPPPYMVALLLAVAVILTEAVLSGRGKEAFLRLSSLREAGLLARRRRGTVLTYTAVFVLLLFALLPMVWPHMSDQRVVVLVTDDPGVVGVSGWPEGRTRVVEVGVGVGEAIDLTASVRRSLASFLPEEEPRIRFHTEAAATRGSAEAALSLLLEQGVAFDLVPVAPRSVADVWVQRVGVDHEPMAGDTVSLQAVVVAGAATPARLQVLRDGAVVTDAGVELLAGSSLLTLPFRLEEAGPTFFEVSVTADGDPEPGNDRGSLMLMVRPSPRVHVVASDPDRGAAFIEAMGLQGLDAVARTPQSLGTRPSDYFDVDVLVLMDVPAISLASTQQVAIETWVRETGGGLLITGGERSFGPGGYYETPLDRVSPLAAKVPREAPEVAMVFVLDRSGSMQQTVDGVTRLDIAKGATLTAVELLGEQSQVAIVVFDEEARVLLPLTSSADLETISAALRPLTPGGGTFMYPALLLAADVLASTDVATRHVIVMTDGLSQPGDFASAVAELVALDATVSSVAIGAGSDVTRVLELAALGGGAAHVTTDFRALPSILAQEAMMLSGDLVVRETVLPRRTAADPGLMEGMPPTMPPLLAFVETTAKADADVLLEDDEGRPLLAAWTYGAGRVVAFASNAVGPWAEAWTEVQAYPSWWSQWSRWTAQVAPQVGMDLRAHVVADEVWVNVVVLTDNGQPWSGLTLVAELRLDGEAEESVPVSMRNLTETTPGRYQGWLPIAPGAAEVRVVSLDERGPGAVGTRVHQAYFAKLAEGWNGVELGAIAHATNGRLLTADAPAWPSGEGSWRLGWRPDWRPWTLLGLVVWLLVLLGRYAPTWLPWRSRSSGSRVGPQRQKAQTSSTGISS